LIERGAKVLRLTEDGRALHERTDSLLAEIAEAGKAVACGAPTPHGRLRVSAPVVLAQIALSRIGARFAMTYPEVQLEIVAEDRMVDPIEDDYDVVIRIDPASDERLVGRRILEDERLVVASSDLPIPTTVENGHRELVVRAILRTNTPSDVVWKIRGSFVDAISLRPQPVLRLSSLLMVREAVLAGAGVALLPKLLVDEDIEAGRLLCWGTQEAPKVDIWALHSSRRLMGAKVRAFLDFLGKSFPDKVFVSPR
jgi:DNA-binding transcriptional LysR family regulator